MGFPLRSAPLPGPCPAPDHPSTAGVKHGQFNTKRLPLSLHLDEYVLLGRKHMFKSVAGLGATVFVLAACAVTPTVTKERMTLGEANIEGMECRKDRAPDTNIPRTICASPESWAVFDEKRRRESAALLAEARKYSNVGRFNRD